MRTPDSGMQAALRPTAWGCLIRCAGCALIAASCSVHAQGGIAPLVPAARRLPEADLLARLVAPLQLSRLGYTKPFVIEGEHIFTSGSVLVASEVIFRPGSKLVLSAGAASGRDAAVYLVTRKITIEPGAAPAIITWAGNAAASNSPPPAGKGAPGVAGYDGSAGGPGADGASGSPGTAGRSPPVMYLATPAIKGGQLVVDWRGQDGGPGGSGQDGGDGGKGGSGKPASSSLFDCRRGAGDGGAGGAGGRGGPGGMGGRGGDGGLFVLLAMPEHVLTLASSIRLDVSSGLGGFGGRGGGPGVGGQPGERGRAAPPFCQDDARAGPKGENGTPGASLADQRGPQGAPGSLAVGELTKSQAAALGIVQ